jgi:glycosyltransferase involved in cell wall biosynthesis
MACLIKVPDDSGKGCVSFTTPERDNLIKKNPQVRASIQTLRARYLIGLHHNWHDHAFDYDPLFDFSMAGEFDLIERNNKEFAQIGIDACNFAPPFFGSMSRTTFHWDVLNVSRAVAFKGIPEFFKAIRAIYDRGRDIRVLYLCPVPPAEANGTTLHEIRQLFESLFVPKERQLFNLMTMEWDYPFPLDLETIAFFYRSSRVYVHPAPDERRCRTAAYAWADRMPVVARENVGSILPASLRRAPFLYEFGGSIDMADAILQALDQANDDPRWIDASDEFSSRASAKRLSDFLDNFAGSRGQRMSGHPINVSKLDIRLGRHHLNAAGPNGIPQELASFCKSLIELDDSEIRSAANAADPEIHISEIHISRRSRTGLVAQLIKRFQ